MLKGDINDIGSALYKAVMSTDDGTAQLPQQGLCCIGAVCQSDTGNYIFIQTDGFVENIGLLLNF